MNKRFVPILIAIYVAIAMFTDIPRAHAQPVPQGINYQAVARDSVGMPLASRRITVRMSIISGGSTGAPVYVEVHDATTDDLGLFTVVIGGGKPLQGTFQGIDWSRRDYWLKIDMDIDGGQSFTELGSQQLMSVPFALYADRARWSSRSAWSDTAAYAMHSADGGGSDSLAWSRRGNNGTDPSVDYLGTGDSADLVLRTNGAERLRISADGGLIVDDLGATGGRVVVTDARRGGRLGSRMLTELIDSAFVRAIGGALPGDSAFVRRLSLELRGIVAHDSVFIDELTRDSVFIARTTHSRDTVGVSDSVLVRMLLNDSAFINRLTGRIDTLFRRDSISIASVVRRVDSVLYRDSVLLNTVRRDTLTAVRLRALADTIYWGTSGNIGTDPSRNFIGTLDARPLAIRTDGFERMRVAAGTGNVGIGTATPAERLQVAGNIRADGLSGTGPRVLVADSTGTIRADAGAGRLIADQVDTLLLRDSSFIEAIGNSAPIVNRIRTIGDSSYWSLKGSRGTNPSRNFIGTLDSAGLALRTNNAERVRVTADGSVGIGTPLPGEKLHVAGGIRSDSLAGSGLRLLAADPNGTLRSNVDLSGVIARQIDTVLSHDATFINNLVNNNTFIDGLSGSTTFVDSLTTNNTFVTNLARSTIFINDLTTSSSFINRITSIGDSSYWSLTGSTGTNPASNFLGTRDNAGLALRTNNIERVRVTAGGSVGIGTTTPGARLQVAGDVRIDSLAGTGARLLTADPNGTLRASTNVSAILLPQIDTALAHDGTFITSLTGNSTFTTSLVNNRNFTTGLAANATFDTALAGNATFVTALTNNGTVNNRIRSVVDSTAWSLTGSTGTNPATNYLGTRDNAGLSIRTNGADRVRVTAGGSVGIGTATPAARLQVAGDVRIDSLAGTGARLLTADPNGTLRASTNVSGILLPQIDTALAHDGIFVTNLINNNTFTSGLAGSVIFDTTLATNPTFVNALSVNATVNNRIRSIIDSTAWSLTGSTGTNPTTNYLGTRDNADLSIRTNGADRVRVTAGGSVGIGTAAPTAKLQVAGDIRVDSLAGSGLRLLTADATGRLGASTNVSGILLPQIDTALAHDGTFTTNLVNNNTFTTSLAANTMFDTALAGNATFVTALTNNSTVNNRIRSVVDSTAWSLTGSTGTNPATNYLGTRDNADLSIRTNGADRVRVTAGGSVGIGTTTPTERLQVAGNIRVDSLAGTGLRLMVANPNGTLGASTNVSGILLPQIDTALAHDGTFITNLTGDVNFINRVRALGDSSSWSLFGTAGTNPATNFLGTTDNVGLSLRTNNVERVRVTAGGSVGIGATNPTAKLQVAGDLRVDSLAGSGLRLLTTDATGRLGASTNVSGILLPQIDTALAHDGTFITNLTNNPSFVNGLTTSNTFVTGLAANVTFDTTLATNTAFITALTGSSTLNNRIRSVVDSTAWSLTGSVGTNPATNYLGTRDNVGLSIRTNNADRVRVTAGGNVGIGTATPGAKLHVAGAVRIDSLAGAGLRVLAADANGSLLANVDLSSVLAHQVDTVLVKDTVFVNAIGSSVNLINRVRTIIDSASWSLIGSVGTNPATNFIGTRDYVGLSLRTNNLERVRVTAGGSVGVGTSTPTAKLQVAGDVRVDSLAGAGLRLLTTDATGRLGASTNVSGILLPQIDTALAHDGTFVTSLTSNPNFVTGLTTNNTFVSGLVANTMFDTTLATNATFITALTGGTTLGNRLRAIVDSNAWSLTGSIGTNPATNFIGTRDNVGLSLRTSNTERVRIDAAGNVGIGTATPTERLEVRDGNLLLSNGNNVASELRLQEPSGSGSSYLALRARPMSANLVFEFPDQQGAPNTLLSNDGSGHLSWADPTVLVGNSVWSVNGNTGLANTLFGTLDDNPIRFITGSGGPNERLRIAANGFIGINDTAPANFLNVVNNRTTDELAAVYGVARGSTGNQAIGIWGDADSSAPGNTGTIGVLATGNGRTAAAETNVALQINDGGINVGRTSEASPGYNVVENATGGINYSAEGPSGVIEVNNLGGLLGVLGIGQSLILNRVTIRNRYVTPNSIVLVQVVDASGTTLGGLLNITFSTLVDDRANGSFKLSVSAHLTGLLPLTLGGTDGIRIGYMVINPSK